MFVTDDTIDKDFAPGQNTRSDNPIKILLHHLHNYKGQGQGGNDSKLQQAA